jgi:hypothetical protein
LTATGWIPVDVPNAATTSFPLVMIPAFAVPLSLILHGVSLWQLTRGTRAATPALSALPG